MQNLLVSSLFVLVFSAMPLGVMFVANANALDTTTGSVTGVNTSQTQTTGVNTSGGTTLLNPLQGGASLEEFLISILDFVIRIGTIVVILMLVYVGFKFVVAQGSDSKITEAKQMLLWTLIGALILLGAKAIAIGIGATVQALSVGS